MRDSISRMRCQTKQLLPSTSGAHAGTCLQRSRRQPPSALSWPWPSDCGRARLLPLPSMSRSDPQRICHGGSRTFARAAGRVAGWQHRRRLVEHRQAIRTVRTAARFGSASASRWHARRRVSVLVARQQNHRFLRRRQAQNRTGRRRNRGHAVLGTRSAGRSVVAAGDDYSRHQLPRGFPVRPTER